MDERNVDDAPRIPWGGSPDGGLPWQFDTLLRRFLIAAGLAAVGLIATPVGILLSGSVLFFWRHFPDVAQGFSSALTFAGILAAPLGAIYWFVAGAWLSGRVGQPSEDRGAPWGVVIMVYVACLIAIAVLIGLTRR